MLTATYSLVAIAAEQDRAQGMVARLQQYLQGAWQGLQNIDFAFLDHAVNRLFRLDDYCRLRKIEQHLVPLLRGASREADGLIAELDALSAKGAELVHGLREQFAFAFDLSRGAAGRLCHSMELYCDCLSARLKKEEEMLLPLARRLLSFEQWFALAEKFLPQQAELSRPRREAGTPHRLAACSPFPLRH
jgi:hemerythrin-like domain-containing protein